MLRVQASERAISSSDDNRTADGHERMRAGTELDLGKRSLADCSLFKLSLIALINITVKLLRSASIC